MTSLSNRNLSIACIHFPCSWYPKQSLTSYVSSVFFPQLVYRSTFTLISNLFSPISKLICVFTLYLWRIRYVYWTVTLIDEPFLTKFLFSFLLTIKYPQKTLFYQMFVLDVWFCFILTFWFFSTLLTGFWHRILLHIFLFPSSWWIFYFGNQRMLLNFPIWVNVLFFANFPPFFDTA